MAGEQLRVTEGSARGQRLTVGRELLIGRAMGADGRLGDDPGLSRRHARVARDAEGRLTVEDLGSANGTFVNGRRVDARHTLEVGDVITVGATNLEVIAGEAPIAVPTGPYLLVVEGAAEGRRVAADDLILGRTVAGEGRLADDPEVSRQHARVARDEDGRLSIEDLGSANGTFVNGVRVHAAQVLDVGDLVRVGQTTLQVIELEEAPATSPARADLDEGPAPPASRVEPHQAPTPPASRVEPHEAPAQRASRSLLADLVIRHRAWILVAALALIIVGIVLGAPLPGLLRTGDDFADPGSQSSVKEGLLARVGGAEPGPDAVAVVRADGGRIGSPPLDALARQGDGDASRAAEATARRARSSPAERKVARVARVMQADPNTARVLTYYQAATPTFVSKDRRATYVLGFLRDGSNARDTAKRLRAQLSFLPGVSLGGAVLVGDAVGRRTGSGLAIALAIAIPLLYLLSLALLRGFVAALLPVIAAIFAASLTLLGLRLANAVTSQSTFTLELVVGLGVGLAAAYAVLVVARHREAASTRPPSDALRHALKADARTVVCSALAVAVALLSLVAFPQRVLDSVGVGGAISALAAGAAAIIVLPALLAALGQRVDALAPASWQRPQTAADIPRESSGHWYRLSQWVLRRPALVLATTAALLLAAGLPLLGLKSTGVDAGLLAQSSSPRQVALALQREFAVDPTATIRLAVAAPPTSSARIGAYAGELRRLPDVASVGSPRRLDRGTWQLDVEPAHPAFDQRTRELVDRIRDQPSPFPVAATGEAAALVDGQHVLGARLALALILLVLATSAVLLVMTRSLIVAIASLVTSVLVAGATTGLVALVFQHGAFAGLLGYADRGALYTTQANLLAAVAFALSTAYTLLVVARVREARAAGADSDEAVSLGLERSGAAVTGAALLFAVAVGAFAIAAVDFVEALVVGAVLAVLLATTVGRALIVPSLLGLAGKRDW